MINDMHRCDSEGQGEEKIEEGHEAQHEDAYI
jgi:hypothetical protein